jgi:NAD(P)H-hydrate epimerase
MSLVLIRKLLQATLVKKFIPARKLKSRKGDNGTVLVLGGSYIYHGAPILSSIAALRSGVDLVYTCVPKINVTPTRAISPNLIVIPLVDQKLTRGAANKLIGALPRKLDSATIGMGLAVQDKSSLTLLIQSLLDRDVRLSLDASALIPEVLPLLFDKNVVVTPHAGEFKRLFGIAPSDSKKERIALVEKNAKDNGIVVLLKGSTDIISDGNTTYLNEKKTPAMTVGGTGDVLSGLVAGMLAKNRNALESAAAATFINGIAGKMVQKKFGLHMTSMDLLGELASAMKPFDRIV